MIFKRNHEIGRRLQSSFEYSVFKRSHAGRVGTGVTIDEIQFDKLGAAPKNKMKKLTLHIIAIYNANFKHFTWILETT